ncbi:MAG: PDZ domain-containing protein [Planctomycetota bacterium]|nr:MAG: PDZ domain-containing protein [Planctomycetota bacterium]
MSIQKKIFFGLLSLFIFPIFAMGSGIKDLEILQKAVQESAAKAAPYVVQLKILATPTRPRYNPFSPIPYGRGSGNLSTVGERYVSALIASEDGLLLTDASHLVGKINSILAIIGSKEYPVKIVAKDYRFNLALLKIGKKEKDLKLKPISFEKPVSLRVGTFVATVGKAYDSQSPTVSFGIISAVHRYGDYAIQTDAAVSPGCTGGALVDLKGNILGMVVTLTKRVGVNSGIGFAIPLSVLKKSLEIMKKEGTIKPAFFGIRFTTHPKGGIKIEEVVKGSAAEKSGIQVGDQVIEMNGTKIKDMDDFRKKVMLKRAGEEIHLLVLRNGKTLKIKAVLGVRPGIR